MRGMFNSYSRSAYAENSRTVCVYIYHYTSSSAASRNSYFDRRFAVDGLAHGAARGTPLLRLKELKFGEI
jgi:hypothetical protein